MADRILKPDSGNDLKLQNNGGTSAIQINDDQSIDVTLGTSSGDDFAINSTHLVVEGDTGNVGIGTTSPDSYDGEADNLVVYGTGHVGITIASGTTGSGKIHFADGTSTHDRYRGIIDYDHADNSMKFATNASQRMTIDTSGNVLIGKTTAGSSAGIQLEPAGAVYSIRSGGPAGLFGRNAGTGEVIRIMDDGADVGSIDTDGSNASYNTSSDYRLKENIVAMSGSIDRLKLFKPSKFNFIANADKTVDGFIAHEAQEVVPEAVTGEKDAMKTEEYTVSEAKGEVFTPAVKEVTESNVVTTEAVAEVILETDVEQPEELTEGQQWRETTAEVTAEREVPHMQGIDQSKLVPLLVGALQEAITRIETLENA